MSEPVIVTLKADEAASVATIARALPDPSTLAAGTKVIVLAAPDRPSLTARLLSAVGRGKAVPKAHRCTALLARGYERIGATQDPKEKDLAWGFVPG